MKNDGTLGNFYYLAFEAIRKRFLYTILKLLKESLKSRNEKIYKKFLKTEKIVLNRCQEGAYFYGKSNFC